MTITIGTVNLIAILTDALHCADTDPDSVGPGVHVATHRTDVGDEPGASSVLAVTSTDRFVIGHTWAPIDGQMLPSVWPVDAAKNVLVICKSLVATRGKEHTVDFETVEQVAPPKPAGDEKPAHPGYLVTLRETPALFKTDTEFQFAADHPAKFPLATVRRALDGSMAAASEDDVEDGPETLWSARVLSAVSSVAKRRKAIMRFFRTPGHRLQVVQIGGTWLGAVMPGKPLPGESLTEPSIDPLFDPGDALRDIVAEMKANGVTVSVENPRGAVGANISAAADLLRNGSGVVTEDTVTAVPSEAGAE